MSWKMSFADDFCATQEVSRPGQQRPASRHEPAETDKGANNNIPVDKKQISENLSIL